MDLRTLELFHHLAGSLHFSRTSQSCNISPSALTRVIQRLETAVGKQLFIPDRSLKNTPKMYSDVLNSSRENYQRTPSCPASSVFTAL
jgi:hypothetical protein